MDISLIEPSDEEVDGQHLVFSLVRTQLKHVGLLTRGTCEIINLTVLSC